MTEKKHRPKRKAGKLMLYIMIGCACVIIAGAILIFPMMMEGAERGALVKIPANATYENVSDTLTKYFGKSYSDKIIRFAKVRNIDFSKRHGAYQIEDGMSAFQAMVSICRRGQTPIRLTINGFRSLDLLADRVSAKMDFTPEEFRKAATDSAMLARYGLKPSEAMSLFLDDTYEVYWTATPEEVVKKIADNYSKFWNQSRLDKLKNLGVTADELSIIASIVDEETNQKDEKGIVGRLYINRLKKGMKLQSDPTVRFALNDFTIKRVKGEHLKYDSPFNTYMYAGLPPGPLRTTSAETIDLILDSKPNDYLYMCAREDFSGYHNFATDYAEHVRNALKYQHALDARGIK